MPLISAVCYKFISVYSEDQLQLPFTHFWAFVPEITTKFEKLNTQVIVMRKIIMQF